MQYTRNFKRPKIKTITRKYLPVSGTAVSVPVKLRLLGTLLEAPVRSLLIKQKEKLHGGGSGDNSGSIVSSVFEIFVLSMVTYFIISIVNSSAQSYQKKLTKDKED